MAYSYKGGINFGLVYIPVTLHSAIKHTDVGFNLIDKKTMSRVRYKKTCEDCGGREVKQEDIVKGYEYEQGKYVIFEDKDFEKIKTKKEKSISIEKFVNLAEIDPLYFDKPYYVVPTGAEKAFSVLVSAMEEEKKAAIAKTVLGAKETLIMIRAKDGQMLLNTLFFDEEVTKNPAKEVKEKGNELELKTAKAIIEGMSGTFTPEEYKNEYREKVREAIERKIAGKEIISPKESKNNNPVNLMDALMKSLSNLQTPKSAKKKPPELRKSQRRKAQ
ncbi:MAG: Ku protein [Candidatus Borkfalkiaceae bacterium]|nr:Ku protein [Clostridia bacterium]MDY6222556.1 Ku protein [Christensenellaceae bacterium]